VSSPLSLDRNSGPSKNKKILSIADSYFSASQRRIGMLYHENTLIAAQCSFLTAVYLMMTMQILAFWKFIVQAGSACLAWSTSQGRMSRTGHPGATESFENDNKSWQGGWMAKGHHSEESLYWSCLKTEM
jgi:hypothetical protein